jgi:hypothetical protein
VDHLVRQLAAPADDVIVASDVFGGAQSDRLWILEAPPPAGGAAWWRAPKPAPGERRWTTVPLPGNRSGALAALAGSKCYVFGGTREGYAGGAPGPAAPCFDVAVLDVAAGTWKAARARLPEVNTTWRRCPLCSRCACTRCSLFGHPVLTRLRHYVVIVFSL